MKKFDTLNDQEKQVNQANQGNGIVDASKSTISVKPSLIITIAVAAIAVIAVLCLVLFGGHKSAGNTTFPAPVYSNSPVNSSSTNDTTDSTIPYSGPNDEKTPVTDLRTSEKLSPQVITYEYCVSHGYLHYYVKLYNPSANNMLKFPTIRITARDADGIILGSEEMVFHELYPGQESNYASQSFAVDETPASVTIEPLEAQDYAVVSINKLEHKEFAPLVVSGVALRNDKVVGEVINENDYSISMARVSVVYRNDKGEMIGSQMDFPKNLSANSSIPIAVSTWGASSEVSSVDVYAEPWM